MKRRLTMAFVLTGAILFTGPQMIRAQEGNSPAPAPAAQATAYGYDSYSADCYGSCDVGCGAEVGCDVGCGVESYGCDGCYGACDVGYCGDCVSCGGCGLLPFLSGVVSVALTPVHWVAELLSCGTFADCGCAPPCEPCYSNPCDVCGNYVGDGGCSSCGDNYYGYDGYYSQNQAAKGNDQVAQSNRSRNISAAGNQRPVNPSLNGQQVNENADYLNYNQIETIGQKKVRRNYQQAKAPQDRRQVGQNYIYQERVLSQDAPMMNNGRPVHKTASHSNGFRNRSTISRNTASQYGQPLR